jgi:hypothetical protein
MWELEPLRPRSAQQTAATQVVVVSQPYRRDAMVSRASWEPNAPTFLWQQISVQSPVGDQPKPQGHPWLKDIVAQWAPQQIQPQQIKFVPAQIVQQPPFRYDIRVVLRSWQEEWQRFNFVVYTPQGEEVGPVVQPPKPYRPKRSDEECVDRPREEEVICADRPKSDESVVPTRVRNDDPIVVPRRRK